MFPAPRGGAFYLSHFILNMSNSKQSAKKSNALDAIGCRNPFCSRGQKVFASEAVFAKTFGGSSAILAKSTTQPMGFSAAATHVCHHWQCARHCEEQMCAPSRCGEWYQQAAVLPAGEDNAATIDFDDAFDENVNGWEDCCLVVKASAVSLTYHTFMHTTDHEWKVDVLKVLDDMNAPDYAFGNILAWARGASAAHYSFNPPGGLSRSKSVDLLFWRRNAKCAPVATDQCTNYVRSVSLKQERNEDKQPTFQATKASWWKSYG
jgi:hypothetical protein